MFMPLEFSLYDPENTRILHCHQQCVLCATFVENCLVKYVISIANTKNCIFFETLHFFLVRSQWINEYCIFSKMNRVR